MTTALAEIESQALQLTPENRVSLADRLLASVWGSPELEEAWSQEAEHCLAELESRRVVSVPVDVANARARATTR